VINNNSLVEALKESIDEYLLYLEQSSRMLEILKDLEVITDELEESNKQLIAHLKKRSHKEEKKLSNEIIDEQLICQEYKIMSILLEIKDYEERLLENLENKMMLPQSLTKRRLIQYFICDIGIRLLLNSRLRYKIHCSIYQMLDKPKEEN